jgi:hypothetical protein
MQQRPAFGGEDAGFLGRRELDPIKLCELGALDAVSAMREQRTDELYDIIVRLREELWQTLDLDNQTRKTPWHAINPKTVS